MEKIFEALDQNNNLTNELKERVQSDVILIINSFPNIDKNKIAEGIRNFKIEALPKFGEYEDVKCLTDNKVLISKNALEVRDIYNVFMQGLLKGLFPNTNKQLEAVHSGITQMIANTLTGGSSDSDEYFLCVLLNHIIDPERQELGILEGAYLAGNLSLILPTLVEKLGSEVTNELLSMSNQNYMLRNTDCQSLLPDMEKLLIDAFFKQNPTKKAADEFDYWVILNPAIFDSQASRYVGLYDVADYYDNSRLEYLNNNQLSTSTKTI